MKIIYTALLEFWTNLNGTININSRIIANHIDSTELMTFYSIRYIPVFVYGRQNLCQNCFCILEHKRVWFPIGSILQRVGMNSARSKKLHGALNIS